MSIIKTLKLVHDYISRDEDGKPVSHNLALNGIDIEIEEGSFVAILGHNGSGKSTLARHFNALLEPTTGTVWIGGYDSREEDHRLDIRKTAGMVFQNPDNQIIASIIEEDVAFGPENIGVPTEEIWKRVASSLKSVGMSAYRYHSPNKLSGGQKQRIAIAGIIAMEPRCMILDEATAMLDPVGRKEVLKAAMELNREKHVTVILITHHMDEAVLADRILVMNKGQVVMDDVPARIFDKFDELKELRLDVPQVVELAYQLRNKGLPLSDGILTIDELAGELSDILGR